MMPPAAPSNGHTLWEQLDDIAVPGLASSKSGLQLPQDPLVQQLQPDFWEALCDSSAFFNSPLVEERPALAEDIADPAGRPSHSSKFQGLVCADELNAMLLIRRDSSTAVDLEVDPLLDSWDGVVRPRLLPHCLSAGPATSLIRFQEEMDQRIAAVDAYFLDPLKVVQSCKEEQANQDAASQEAYNPAALLLTCSNQFIDILQSLTPADGVSTEIALLTLSSYLALMRLFDCLFHTIHKFICQMPPETFKSTTVKSVLRIGGISSLQDMPLKTYATGILDAIQGQVRTLERCMGIPTEYCLSDEMSASPTAAVPGIFSRADRAQLFRLVMAQEDVKSRRGSKLYVESIRANIQESMSFLED